MRCNFFLLVQLSSAVTCLTAPDPDGGEGTISSDNWLLLAWPASSCSGQWSWWAGNVMTGLQTPASRLTPRGRYLCSPGENEQQYENELLRVQFFQNMASDSVFTSPPLPKWSFWLCMILQWSGESSRSAAKFHKVVPKKRQKKPWPLWRCYRNT